jgi:hypothetical protein
MRERTDFPLNNIEYYDLTFPRKSGHTVKFH